MNQPPPEATIVTAGNANRMHPPGQGRGAFVRDASALIPMAIDAGARVPALRCAASCGERIRSEIHVHPEAGSV